MQIIINAGGTGTRLWPLSTSNKPKQFSAIIDSETLIEKTLKRMIKLTSEENIWISTNVRYSKLLKTILPNFRSDRVIIEPEKRDTFAAICSNAAVVAGQTSINETIINIQADAYIPEHETEIYLESLRTIDQAIQNNSYEFMTIGVKPSFANTGLGYVQINENDKLNAFKNPVKVERFTEKPDQETANKFLEEGNYLWHWGTHSFTYKQLIQTLEINSPESISLLNVIQESGEINKEVYNQLPKVAFEYVVTEKIKNLGIIAINVSWDDIGTWQTVYNYLPNLLPDTNHIELAGRGNKIKTNNQNLKVAFVGVSNLLVVQTEDGLLIMNPDNHSEIKQVSNYFDK